MTADFAAHLEESQLSPATVKAYLSDLKHFRNWFAVSSGQVLGSHITAMDAKDYKAHLVRAKASPRTINRRLITLQLYAKFHGIVLQVKKVEEQELAPQWLTRLEQAALLREAARRVSVWKEEGPSRTKAQYNQATIIFLLNTGLRLAEFGALEPGDATTGPRSGQLQVRQGKGGKARTVPMNAQARRALEVLEPLPIRLKARYLEMIITAVGVSAKLAITPHTLRHTFAKNLIDAGSSLQEVATLLGHNNLNTTRRYTTPGQRDLEKAVEALE